VTTSHPNKKVNLSDTILKALEVLERLAAAKLLLSAFEVAERRCGQHLKIQLSLLYSPADEAIRLGP
jgi:hypothetical protein